MRLCRGGTFNLVTQKDSISATMSGAILKLAPLSIMKMHWHPNADEWQYYIKGRARMTVFGVLKITREFGPERCWLCNQGYGHYIESIGTEESEILAVFNTGDYQEILARHSGSAAIPLIFCKPIWV